MLGRATNSAACIDLARSPWLSRRVGFAQTWQLLTVWEIQQCSQWLCVRDQLLQHLRIACILVLVLIVASFLDAVAAMTLLGERPILFEELSLLPGAC